MEKFGIIFCVLMMCSNLSAENTEAHQPPVVETIPDNIVTRLQYLEKQFIEQQLETRKQNELILSALDRLQQNQESTIDQLKSELNPTLDKIQKNVEIHFLNQESLFHQRNDDVKQTLDSFQEIVESRLLNHESKISDQNEELKQSLFKLQRTVESDLLKQPSQNGREIGELNQTVHSLQNQQNNEFKQSIENLQKTVESKFLNQTSMINEQTRELNRSLTNLENTDQKILSSFPSIRQAMDRKYKEEIDYLKTIKDRVSSLPFIRSCKLEPSRKSGPYLLQPYAHWKPFVGYCEQDTFDGGWLVFQNRFNGSVDFYRNWAAYKYGFGEIDGEFWLGLEYLHYLTKGKKHTLLVELTSFDGKYAYAKYDGFEIGSKEEKYALKVLGAYSGTAGDALTFPHKGQKFSTYDNDDDQSDDENCASIYKGAWWFNECHNSLLNGEYLNTINESTNHWGGLQHEDSTEGFKLTRMMVREN